MVSVSLFRVKVPVTPQCFDEGRKDAPGKVVRTVEAFNHGRGTGSRLGSVGIRRLVTLGMGDIGLLFSLQFHHPFIEFRNFL